jgi:hypothetical protein
MTTSFRSSNRSSGRRTCSLIGVTIIVAALSSSTLSAGVPLWSGGVFAIQSREDGANGAFVLYLVRQEGLHLTGLCSYSHIAPRGADPAVIPGTDGRDAGFWPDVVAQVKDPESGKWRTIADAFNKGHRTSVEVKAGENRLELFVGLDVFFPLIGKNKVGRLVLPNGEATVFDLSELLEETVSEKK